MFTPDAHRRKIDGLSTSDKVHVCSHYKTLSKFFYVALNQISFSIGTGATHEAHVRLGTGRCHLYRFTNTNKPTHSL